MPLPYAVSPERYDEAFRGDGTPRPGYDELIEELAGAPRAASDAVRRRLAAGKVEFGSPAGRSTFTVDPVPRLFTAEEWSLLEAGLIQRMRTLQCFLADAYGGRTLVQAGVLPARVLEESRYYEPLLAHPANSLPFAAWVAGPDIIRDADGSFRVLEDNTRSPSGFSYAIAGRRAVRREEEGSALAVRPLDGALQALHETLRSAAPPQSESDEPRIAILSDGEPSTAWYEHHEIAERLRLPLVTPAGLSLRAGRLHVSPGGAEHRIDVLYNRSSQESIRREDGALTPLGELLAKPLLRGTLSCVNAFGMGIADDKAVFPYVDGMTRFYLGEEPILRSVPTFDLGERATFEAQIGRIAELVIKPRWSFGGHGIVLGPDATAAQLRETEEAVRRAPNRFVAQEPIDFSVHPTVAGDRLEPRHVDFRPFVLHSKGHFTVIPGGLTRFAGERGNRVVNSTQGGGAKDTWVLR